ncbi:hypothetical protein CF386_06710 [Paraphotobacterium marinum]|uniref:Major facilitator superfamily (MFS) profile domain-containing protein n=2 Tax=Paraphotobacterium marinum TaxID=1755811 RepID=A0A220VE61_9GAMM|nr:hypothetical protein CF386_06710 [Paraphotobacterium marinum]
MFCLIFNFFILDLKLSFFFSNFVSFNNMDLIMRQVPQAKIIFPFFFIIIIDVMSTNISMPVLSYAVANSKFNLFGSYNDYQRHMIFGLLLAILPFCNVLGTLTLGYLSDIYGRKKLLIISIIGTTVSLLIFILSFKFKSLVLLIVANIVVGVTAGSFSIAQAAMADISVNSNRAKNISIIALGLTLGFVISSFIGGVFADNALSKSFNALTPLYVALSLSFISMLVAIFFLKETFPKERRDVFRNRNRKKFVVNFELKKIKLNLVILCLIFFFMELSWGIYFRSIALTLNQYFSKSLSYSGYFVSYVGIIMSIGLFWGVKILARKKLLHKNLALYLLVGSSFMLIAYFTKSITVQWMLGFVVALIVAFSYTSLLTQISQNVSEQKQGSFMGIADGLLSLAFMIGGVIIGKITITDALKPQLFSGLFFGLTLLLLILFKVFIKKSR